MVPLLNFWLIWSSPAVGYHKFWYGFLVYSDPLFYALENYIHSEGKMVSRKQSLSLNLLRMLQKSFNTSQTAIYACSSIDIRLACDGKFIISKWWWLVGWGCSSYLLNVYPFTFNNVPYQAPSWKSCVKLGAKRKNIGIKNWKILKFTLFPCFVIWTYFNTNLSYYFVFYQIPAYTYGCTCYNYTSQSRK